MEQKTSLSDKDWVSIPNGATSTLRPKFLMSRIREIVNKMRLQFATIANLIASWTWRWGGGGK